jgi:hypothetical protein
MRRVTILAALAVALTLALAPAAASGAPAAEAAVAKCDRKVVLRYDITVTGSQSGRETFPADSAFAGGDSVSYDYVVRYRRARVVVDRGCDPFIDTVRVRAKGVGTLQSYLWADRSTRRDPADGTKVPCEFTFAADSLRTRLILAAGTTVLGGGPPTFSIDSALRRAGELPLLAQIDARHEAACDKGSFPNFPSSQQLALHGSVPIFERPARAGGFRVEPPSVFLDGSLLFAGRRNPRALKRLVAGRSARISTGVRSYEGTDDQSSATASTRVAIRFARRR